jgi:hypothetical protein
MERVRIVSIASRSMSVAVGRGVVDVLADMGAPGTGSKTAGF